MSSYSGSRGVLRRDRNFTVFSMSFLDAICCAFGALILIMVLAQVGRPKVIQAIDTDLGGLIERREQELEQIRGDVAAKGNRLRDLDADSLGGEVLPDALDLGLLAEDGGPRLELGDVDLHPHAPLEA